MDVLQIVLSGASDDEAIGDAQGVPTSMSRGKFESAPVIVSGDPTTSVPGGGAARAERTRSGHNNGQEPIPLARTPRLRGGRIWPTSTPPTSTGAVPRIATPRGRCW